jgi:hypothetical protein
MDVWYVDNRSFALDARILWRTIVAVLSRNGISAGENMTMPPFDPSKTSDITDKEPRT